MLILGIESATAKVGCAIGGHEGGLASTHSARARRHAESLAPQPPPTTTLVPPQAK